MNRYDVIITIALVTTIISSLTLGTLIGGYMTIKYPNTIKGFMYYEPMGNVQINNISIEEESTKLYNNVKEVFKYNLSELYNEYNLTTLISNGGVCWQWAEYYIELAKQDGFDADKITYWYNETKGHAFALLKGAEGYCILDQGFPPECRRVG